MRRCHQVLASLSIMSILALLFAQSCAYRRADDGGQPEEAFVENGKAWALGNASLTTIQGRGWLILERKSGSGGSSDNYDLYGVTSLTDTAVERRQRIEYVDYYLAKDQSRKLLVFVSSWRFEPRAGETGTVDIYAVLRRPGYSVPSRTEVFVGAAAFDAGSDRAIVYLRSDTVRMFLSNVSDGVAKGSWAIHIPRDWSDGSTTCQTIAPLPDSRSGQIASAGGCDYNPAVADELCPDKSQDCSVKYSASVSWDSALSNFRGRVAGLTPVSGSVGLYKGVLQSNQAAKITYIANAIKAAETDNARLCDQAFSALVRTPDNRISDGSCAVTASTAAPDGGKLACAVEVTPSLKVAELGGECFVRGVFWGEEMRSQAVHIQVERPEL